MAESLNPVYLSNNTTNDLVAAANSLIDKLASVIVTANNSANGGQTTGNGYITGIFGASTLVVGTGLRGGSVNASANLVISSNITVTGTSLTIGNSTVNTFANSTTLIANNLTASNATIYNFALGQLTLGNTVMTAFTTIVTNTNLQVIDSFSKVLYRSAEYTIQLEDSASNNYELTKLLVLHDGTSGYLDEYGMAITNTSLGTFSVTVNSTAVALQMTPTSANVYIMGTRTTYGPL